MLFIYSDLATPNLLLLINCSSVKSSVLLYSKRILTYFATRSITRYTADLQLDLFVLDQTSKSVLNQT